MANKAKQGVGTLMQIAWNYQQAAKLVASSGYGQEIDTTLALKPFADAVELVVLNHLNEVQVSWQSSDPEKQDWGNDHSKLVMAYGNIHLTVRIQILKDRAIDKKVRKIMSDPNATMNVMLSPWNWNGFNSNDVKQFESRQVAIEHAMNESVDQKDPLISLNVEFDDGNRIVIHIEHGYYFYGWRISHQYFYFDPRAEVKKAFDEVNFEEYEVHELSMTNMELSL